MTSHERHVASNHRSFQCLYNNLCGPTSMRHQSPYHWPFVRGIHRWAVNSPRKGPVTWKKTSIWWRHHVIVYGLPWMKTVWSLITWFAKLMILVCKCAVHESHWRIAFLMTPIIIILYIVNITAGTRAPGALVSEALLSARASARDGSLSVLLGH